MRLMHVCLFEPIQSVYSIYCYECWWCCWLLRCRLMQLTICLFLFLLDWHVVYCYAHIVCVSKTCLFKWYVIFSKSSSKNTQMNGIQQQRQKYHKNTVLNVTDAVSMKFNAFWKEYSKIFWPFLDFLTDLSDYYHGKISKNFFSFKDLLIYLQHKINADNWRPIEWKNNTPN